MTKMQKVWFGIFLGMFIVPEILWGGLLSTFFGFKPVFDLSDISDGKPVLGTLLVLPEVIGILALLFLNKRFKYKNNTIKYINAFILIGILVALGFSMYLSY